MSRVDALRALEHRVGERIFSSEWFTVEQDQVDDFARNTNDWDRQHNDPESAKDGPFGGTIVHGYLMVALAPDFVKQSGVPVESSPELRGVNYGLDRVRFPHHLRVGAPARWHIDVLDYQEPSKGTIRLSLRSTIELRDSAKPAMVADAVFLYFVSAQSAD